MGLNNKFTFVLFSFLMSFVLISSGDILLDTSANLNGWSAYDCTYAEAYTEEGPFSKCPVDVSGDDENNKGYWSFCDSMAFCRLVFTVGDTSFPEIQLRVFMVPKSPSTPFVQLVYRNPGGGNTFERIPTVQGWQTANYKFKEELLPGAVS